MLLGSGNYGWGAGVDPEGFILSGEGIPDPAFPSVKYNIVGGSIYGGRIAAADLQSSSLPWADVAGAPETLKDLDSAANTAIGTAQSTADSKVLPSDVANAINTNTTTIDGAKITAGSISANTIDVNGISANQVKSGYLTTSGLSAQTSGTAETVMDSKGIRVYDALGVLRVKIGDLA